MHILAELREAFDVHRRMGSVLGGVHFELTGEDVTECAGGPQGLQDAELSRAYETFCDPRLNDAGVQYSAPHPAERWNAPASSARVRSKRPHTRFERCWAGTIGM